MAAHHGGMAPWWHAWERGSSGTWGVSRLTSVNQKKKREKKSSGKGSEIELMCFVPEYQNDANGNATTATTFSGEMSAAKRKNQLENNGWELLFECLGDFGVWDY